MAPGSFGTDEQFGMLRVAIEAQLQKPMQIAVGTATEEDGGRAVAVGLAAAFARDGRRTAFVDIAKPSSGSNRGGAAPPRPLVSGVDVLSASADVPEFLHRAKAQYEVTVIDVGVVSSSSASLSATAAADGVVLAVVLGRPANEVDQRLPQLLARVRAHVLGVVTVNPEWLAHGSTSLAIGEPSAVRQVDAPRSFPAEVM